MTKTKNWDDLVAAGREAVDQETDAKWALGDLALEAAPMGKNRANNDSASVLAEYAEAIGVDFETLRDYRRVAAAWPHGARAPCAWSVHRELRDRDDRTKLLARLVKKHDRVTVDLVREQLGKRKTRGEQPRDRDEKVAVAKELLADEEVREEIARDNDTRAAMSRTNRKLAAEEEESVDRKIRERAPRLHELGDILKAAHRLAHARQDIRQALDLLQGFPRSDEARDRIADDVAQLDESVALLHDFVAGTVTVADEAAEFLARQDT